MADPPCTCDEGYTGTHCQCHATVAANAAHCSNAGTCDASGGASVADPPCTCEEGYAGRHCEHDCSTTEASRSHCSNAGTCDASGGANVADPPCTCEDGRNGPHCEVRVTLGQDCSSPLSLSARTRIPTTCNLASCTPPTSSHAPAAHMRRRGMPLQPGSWAPATGWTKLRLRCGMGRPGLCGACGQILQQ